MRILHIIAGGAHGGAETFFVDLVDALSARGIDQCAFTRHFDERIYRLRKCGCAVETARLGGPLDFISPIRFSGVLKRWNPDITLSWMSRAAALVRPGPCVNIGRLGGYYALKYYEKCDYLICNTPDIVNHCIDGGWANDRVNYIPNFSPNVQCTPADRSTLNTPEDSPVLLVLARLEETKGIDVAVRALQDVPGAYLWIAGEGSQLGSLQRLTADLDLQGRVRFLGWRSDREALLQAADVCIVPSRHEPFGNVVVNAWQNETPVVATRSQGPSFLIEHDSNGLLAPVDDAAELAASIRRLIGDSGLVDRVVGGGKEQISGSFSTKAVVDAYCSLFDRVQTKKSEKMTT